MTRVSTAQRPALRQARIAELVAKRGEVSVEAMAKRFDASAETIRRDLTILAESGQIRKVHGGARSFAAQDEGVFDARMRRNALAKRLIAEKVANIVTPRQTLFMDTGSTTLICAEALAHVKKLIIITNSTRIAATFAAGSGGSDVYLLGGLYRGDNAQTVGATSICDVARYRADWAILTVGALDIAGPSDFSNHEAEVARAMIKASARVRLLVDHSKFGRNAAFSLCALDAVDQVVVDKAPDHELGAALRHSEVEVI